MSKISHADTKSFIFSVFHFYTFAVKREFFIAVERYPVPSEASSRKPRDFWPDLTGAVARCGGRRGRRGTGGNGKQNKWNGNDAEAELAPPSQFLTTIVQALILPSLGRTPYEPSHVAISSPAILDFTEKTIVISLKFF